MNILILTSIYPQKDDEENIGVTPVVKDFAEEWRALGHNVIVIHNSVRYPKWFYLLPGKIIKKINSLLGIVIPNKNQSKVLSNINSEGVPSFRLPMLKIIPRKKHSNKQVEQQFFKINQILDKKSFTPDVVVGHWENPQIPLLSMFKGKFEAKTALVFHKLVYIKQNRYKAWSTKYIEDIDKIGARSPSIANEVKELMNMKQEPFICHSGMPDKYFDINQYKRIDFNKKTPDSFLYVGRLIKRKNVAESILALKNVYDDQDFKYNVVGVGPEKERLTSFTNKLNLNNHINFLGYKQRDKVIELMNQTEIFIMISDDETFGLVYIEAMSRGCIVIASKNGGMDGIIKNGYNGFLCNQGDEVELEKICEKINEMSISEKTKISRNAINTASDFSNSKIAQKYLETVIH